MRILMTFALLALSFSSVVQAQNIIIDNQTDCYYVLNLLVCNPSSIDCNGPLDAPPNQVTQNGWGTVGLSNANNVGIICICLLSGTCEDPPITINPCSGGISPVHTCSDIDCQSNTIYVDWWISSGSSDFNILIRY